MEKINIIQQENLMEASARSINPVLVCLVERPFNVLFPFLFFFPGSIGRRMTVPRIFVVSQARVLNRNRSLDTAKAVNVGWYQLGEIEEECQSIRFS